MEEQEGGRRTTLTFPFNSKRLQLHHIQLIAESLCLLTTASASDLSVMIGGKLCENSHDPSNTQIVITQSEEGEELSLQDMDGVFLRIPAVRSTLLRTSPSPSSEVSVELQPVSALQENINFSAEVECLEHLLSTMKEELVKSRTQLLEAQEEIACLRVEISDHSSESPERAKFGEGKSGRVNQ